MSKSKKPLVEVDGDVVTENEASTVVETKSYIINPCGESVNVSEMGARLGALKLASTAVGAQRAKFLQALSKVDKDIPVITVNYGGASVSVNSDRAFITEPSTGRLAKHPAGVHPACTTALPGSASANKMIGRTIIPCGVCLVVAGGGTGKTPLSHALASHGVRTYSTVRVGEPLAGYASSQESVAFSLAVAMLENSDIVLDSIKDLLSSGGAAMKSGLSRDALVSISGLASAACEAGCTVYVPVNPSTPDPDVLELLAEAARSNATMTIVSVGAKSWKYSSRQGESLQRTNGSLFLDYDSAGLATVKFSGAETSSEGADETVRHIATIVSHTAITSAQRRAMNQSFPQE